MRRHSVPASPATTTQPRRWPGLAAATDSAAMHHSGAARRPARAFCPATRHRKPASGTHRHRGAGRLLAAPATGAAPLPGAPFL